MDPGDFDSVSGSWRDEAETEIAGGTHNLVSDEDITPRRSLSGKRRLDPPPLQAGSTADAVDLAGIGDGRLDCTVDTPLKENDGTKDAYISYLVTTHTDFKTFQKPDFAVRRRYTDFYFLFRTLSREYPACAVPPLPDKHKMEYVRGDRFGSDFTTRRANSLHRFLRRLTLHPVLRRATLLAIFLESPDWNAHMKSRPNRGSSVSEQSNSVFDNFADTFVNAFSKVHKPDKRFIEVNEKADKLNEDLGHIEKMIARVARRQADLETDYNDLAIQFQRLVPLEPGVERPLNVFAACVTDTAKDLKVLKDHIDQNYLGSLRDMEAYIVSLRGLLKTREQKQLDFEGLSDYLARASTDRDNLASSTSSYSSSILSQGPTSFLRSKLEDVRGVDHEAARRERVRKLELRIEDLVREVEDARKTSEMFDEQVVREVTDFERIKKIEFKEQLGMLADRQTEFFAAVVEVWEGFLTEMGEEVEGKGKDNDKGR
ncbi:MAG: intercellular trafficking and secretion [Cirrosporium novae-zelandiae]|nr:MAG: intercellular trafficking and secretion [Cirrosporium novae-zelandiae]